MIEYVQDMFEPADFHCAAEIRNFFKSYVSQLLFFLLQPGISIDLSICSSD